jgi:hypothetical protein
MNDYLIFYVVYNNNKSFIPLETRKMKINAYSERNAIEQFPYWDGLIAKIERL